MDRALYTALASWSDLRNVFTEVVARTKSQHVILRRAAQSMDNDVNELQESTIAVGWEAWCSMSLIPTTLHSFDGLKFVRYR